MTGHDVPRWRRDELAANLSEVRHRIELACSQAGRQVADVTLVVVTKTWPASDVDVLADLGVTDVGENRDQEAGPKHDACTSDLRWHFIGQLQRNKARSVARYADVVESVDRHSLAVSLAAAREPSRPLDVLIQVNLDAAGNQRGGVQPGAVDELAEQIAELETLRIAGVMAVAPLGVDPDACFERLREVSNRLQGSFPDARIVSAGMSGDLESAIRQGATQVRVGTAVLGHRPAVGYPREIPEGS